MKHLLCILGFIFIAGAFAIPEQIIIVRHGEKANIHDISGINNLSCMGLHRALGLVGALSRFGAIGQIYIPTLQPNDVTGETGSSRMFQTVSPFAIVNKININSSYSRDDVTDLATDIMGSNVKKVLVVWDHHNIPKIAAALRIPPQNIPKWQNSDFDSIWIITPADGTHPIRLTFSTEGLNPSSSCSF